MKDIEVNAIDSTTMRSKLGTWSAYIKTFDFGHASTGIFLWPLDFRLDSKPVRGCLFKRLSTHRVLALVELAPMKIGVFELKNKEADTHYGTLTLTPNYASDIRTNAARLKMFGPVFNRLCESVKWLKSGTDIVTYDPKLYIAFKTYLMQEPTDKDLLALYNKYNDLYHNGGKSPLTDQQFDDLGDILQARKIKPTTVGAVPSRDKTTLPMKMGSQEKIKPDGKSLAKFVKQIVKGKVVKSLKYDGISLLLHYQKGRLFQAYTRGDGYKGRIVTHQVIKLVPLSIKDPTDLFVRAEAIMAKKVFVAKYKSLDTPNARNMMSGFLNRKEAIPAAVASDIHVVAFEIMNWKEQDKQTQLSYLKKLGFRVAHYTVHDPKDLNEADLSKDIADYKKNGDYDIDGLVLTIDHAGTRNKLGLETNSLNPKGERAFKSGMEESAETAVTDVEWKVSKDGYVKPTLILDPVHIAGSTVRRATGFNAKFITDNKINKGSRILLIKSGDVIPFVKEVLTRSKVASTPDASKVGNYKLNATGIDYVLTGQSDAADLQRIIFFFKALETFGVSDATFKKLYDAGYTTLISIMELTARDFEGLPGFQKKSADTAYAAIHKALTNCTMPQLMAASGCFGRAIGETRLEQVYKEFGNALLTDTKTYWYDEVSELPGFADNTARLIDRGLPKFRKFLIDHQNYIKVVKPKGVKGGVLSGQVICPTGFRDKDLFASIVSMGGIVNDGLSKATTLLLVKNSEPTTKTAKAESMGITIMNVDKFRSKYKL